jgi:hypothetical protein
LDGAAHRRPLRFVDLSAGYFRGMSLALLLIIIGIILAILVNYALGIICIVIGLVLLLLPWFRGRNTSRV